MQPANDVILILKRGRQHVILLQLLIACNSPECPVNVLGPLLVLDGLAGGVAGHQEGLQGGGPRGYWQQQGVGSCPSACKV